jgi:hypothetical protein
MKLLKSNMNLQQFFLKVGDYSDAERAFSEFVKRNPEHELAGSAQYWLAEIFTTSFVLINKETEVS